MSWQINLASNPSQLVLKVNVGQCYKRQKRRHIEKLLLTRQCHELNGIILLSQEAEAEAEADLKTNSNHQVGIIWPVTRMVRSLARLPRNWEQKTAVELCWRKWAGVLERRWERVTIKVYCIL